MKFANVLLTVSCLICILLGLTPRAMSRAEVQGQSSETSKEPSVNPTSREKTLDGMIILYGTNENANTSIPPPPMQQLNQNDNFFETEQSQFLVTYTGFTDEAREAFQYAVDIWNSLIRSPVPIRIDATFTDFSGYEGGKIILGGAYPAGWKSPGSLNLWFVDALADKRAGRDLEAGEPDIITRFNSHKDVNWYFGTDANTPAGKMDFLSVVIHEIGHGLGFFSTARAEDSPIGAFSSFSTVRGKLRGGVPELPHIFDVFVVNGSGTAIMEFRDPSTHLLEQFTSNNLFWNGANGVAANGGGHPQLYAPSTWDKGSGYAHLDETIFPAGDVNSLMTPYFDKQEAIHDPGPIALGMLEDIGWVVNKAPLFTEGSIITRTVVEKTAANVSIGSPIVATDANNEPLTYHLSGIDAAAFDIDSTSGQLKTKAVLHHETKAAYTVTVTVSDGSLIDEITVIITVVNKIVEVPTNSPPNFIDGGHTSRAIAENTPRGVNIREPIAATDADNDALIYTLSGPDAASFHLDRTTGQLRTLAALDYETKRTYTVKVTVSDGNLTDTITVTVAVIDVDDQKSPTIALTSQPLKEATLNGSIVTLKLNNGVYESWLNDSVTVTGVAGVTVKPFSIERKSDTQLAVQITFDGTDFDTNATLTFSVKADAIASYSGPALTATAPVTAVTESVNASSAAPLTETTLNRGVVTLTLRGRIYESSYTVGNNVAVSGVTGVTINRFNVERISDTQVNIELMFDGTDFDTNATLTFKIGADAVMGYNGAELVSQLPVTAVAERHPIIFAFAPRPLTESTLNEDVVTLTLANGVYAKSISNIRRALQVAGIAGVTFPHSHVTRLSDTQVTLKLAFDGTNFDTDTTLTFSVGPSAIAAYNGPPLTAEIPVTAVVEESPTLTLLTPQPITEATLDASVILLTLNNATYVQSNTNIESAATVSGIVGVTIKTSGVKRISDTEIAVELAFDGNFDTDATLTFTIEADAIAGYDGRALIVQILVTGGEESVVASTPIPLTETTLNESIITLTLNGAAYEQSTFDIRDAVSVSGIDGVTFHWFDVDRVSDTELTVELTFKDDFDTDATLTFTVGAGAIVGYDGPALVAQLPVTGGKESVAASTESPLTEATLDGSVVTLTLSGRKYARSIFDIRGAVSVSGVDGVTIPWHEPDRQSDTEITIKLEFKGDLDADAMITFTVGADALLGYNGPALTVQLPVTVEQESIVASTEAPLTEATLHESVVTLTLTGRTYARSTFDIRDAVSVSGIDGVTIPWHEPDRQSDTQITVELEFNGDIDTDATLTFTIGPGAIAGYDGPIFTVQLPVTGGQESIVASTKTPLTEDTLDGSVVTLTLSGRKYARSIFDIRGAVSVSGIDGVTIPWHEPDRKNNTEITIELEFDGDMDTDGVLTFTVGSDAIAEYNGPALTAQIPVTAIRENFLLANFPNPFNPETWIPYQLAKPAEVTITIYAINGQVVRTLALGHQSAGIYQSRSRAAYWDGRNTFGEPVASGLYFYTLTAGDFTATRKMLIQK